MAGAKEIVKSRNLKDPKLTILLSSLYNNSFPDFTKKWEELTGVKFEIEPYTRFKGQTGEQSTMFFRDPSGNAIEIKAFADRSRLFAKD